MNARHRRPRSRFARRRGGTFTIIVMILSVLLLGVTSALYDPTRKMLEATAFRERMAQAREAAISGLEWGRAVQATAANGTKAKAELDLARAHVVVTFEKAEGVVKLESTATVGARDPVTVHATGVLKDGKLTELGFR
jgi:hypothetical protein